MELPISTSSECHTYRPGLKAWLRPTLVKLTTGQFTRRLDLQPEDIVEFGSPSWVVGKLGLLATYIREVI
jgi:hypothetical protein